MGEGLLSSINLSIYLSICLSVCMCVLLSVCMYVTVCVCKCAWFAFANEMLRKLFKCVIVSLTSGKSWSLHGVYIYIYILR